MLNKFQKVIIERYNDAQLKNEQREKDAKDFENEYARKAPYEPTEFTKISDDENRN